GIEGRTARDYMSAAVLYEKTATVAVLPIKTIYRLASKSTPSAVVDIVTAKAAAGEGVPDPEVKDMISDAKVRAQNNREEANLTPRRRKARAKRKAEREAAREAARLAQEREGAEREKAQRRAISILVDHLDEMMLQELIVLLHRCPWG